MKLVFKKSSMEFRPSYPSGTEIPVTPSFSGDYVAGNGYYLTHEGKISYLASYLNTDAAVSNLISVVGFSKIKLGNLYSNQYSGVLAFFTNEEQIQGTSPIVYTGTSGGTLEVNIPSNALYIRTGANINGGGGAIIGPLNLTLVV